MKESGTAGLTPDDEAKGLAKKGIFNLFKKKEKESA